MADGISRALNGGSVRPGHPPGPIGVIAVLLWVTMYTVRRGLGSDLAVVRADLGLWLDAHVIVLFLSCPDYIY